MIGKYAQRPLQLKSRMDTSKNPLNPILANCLALRKPPARIAENVPFLSWKAIQNHLDSVPINLSVSNTSQILSFVRRCEIDLTQLMLKKGPRMLHPCKCSILMSKNFKIWPRPSQQSKCFFSRGNWSKTIAG
jgi:hypothetical protein